MSSRIISLLIAAAVIIFAWVAYKIYCKLTDKFKTVKSDEFEKIISSKEIVVLDVRTAEEFASGHIINAVNINVYESNFIDLAKAELTEEKPVAVYCRSGVRSRKAASQLTKNGYEVVNLDGGILAWKRHGKAVVC
ncbi:MAG: rhodanese-like domain-containing protein [Bacteroidales bacterium]|nr:rhodanese-like domain-containing protein [Bacteroidales bacterium]